jgi:hypothetical protein
MQYLLDNKEMLIGAILGLLFFAECVVLLTPTKTDDGFVERIGGIIRKVLTTLGIPNRIKIEKE